jgi:hypothetical protein
MDTARHDAARSEKIETGEITYHVQVFTSTITTLCTHKCTNLVNNGKTPRKCGHGTHFSVGEVFGR